MTSTAHLMKRAAAPPVTRAAPLPLTLVVPALVVLAAALALSYGLYEPASSHDGITIGCGLAVMALLVYVRYGLHFPWLSASVVYLALFWLFHFGLTFTAVLVPDVLASLADWEIEWLYWSNVRIAMILALIGAAGFVCGLGIMGSEQPARRERYRDTRTQESAFYLVGWLVLLPGLAGSAVSLAQVGGFGALGINYSEFRAVTEAGWLTTFLDLAHLGCLLCLCGARGRRWMMPIAAWCPLGVAMLLVGMRTEALVPVVAYVVVLAHRGVRFPRSVLVLGVAVAMVVIPAIRTLRAVGLENRADVDLMEMSPLETFTELGGTLRATKAYVDWIEQGDAHLLGATYWAPFDRQVLTRLVPGRPRLALEDDERLPERNIDREGSVGLSATGEAYYNFGVFGPFIYFACVGALFAWLERRARWTPGYCATLGVAMLVFLFNIRGHWLSVPANFALGLAAIAFCRMVGLRFSGIPPGLSR